MVVRTVHIYLSLCLLFLVEQRPTSGDGCYFNDCMSCSLWTEGCVGEVWDMSEGDDCGWNYSTNSTDVPYANWAEWTTGSNGFDWITHDCGTQYRCRVVQVFIDGSAICMQDDPLGTDLVIDTSEANSDPCDTQTGGGDGSGSGDGSGDGDGDGEGA